MEFRKATLADIPGMSRVRMAVNENVLSDPGRVTAESYRQMLVENGAGWVCEVNQTIVGFAIVDLSVSNIWALFIDPEYEGKGIGRKLHDMMLNYSFEQGTPQLWLSTGPGTRAETFYRKAGWHAKGLTADGELRFEMNKAQYITIVSALQQSTT